MIGLAIVLLLVLGGGVAAFYAYKRRELELANTRRGAGLSAIARSFVGGLATAYGASLTSGLSAARTS